MKTEQNVNTGSYAIKLWDFTFFDNYAENKYAHIMKYT